jgi:hypothetical protein
MKGNRRLLIGLSAAAALLALAILAVAVWAGNPYRATAEARAAMLPDAAINVRAGEWLGFEPLAEPPTVGLILYPGARVEPQAYAPAARAIAEHGYLVVIVPMPLHLAVLAPNRAQQVIEANPGIVHWAVGGHSLGGAMAARFALHASGVQGLLLWAAYPASTDDLSARPLMVTSIYANNDGLATPEEVLSSASRLPPDAHWVKIEGGNHAGFGWYGPQPGDGTATAPRLEQQRQIVEASLALLDQLEGAH